MPALAAELVSDLVRASSVGWTFSWSAALEGRRPALADNFFQIFIAPVFLVAEVFFALGLKRDVREKVEARLANP
jgi:uncharacterized membrane protein YGL010W